MAGIPITRIDPSPGDVKKTLQKVFLLPGSGLPAARQGDDTGDPIGKSMF
jgi:hypothetical protein